MQELSAGPCLAWAISGVSRGRWGSERQTCEGLPRVIQSMLWVQNASLPYPLPRPVLSLPTMPSIHPLPVPLVLLFPCPEYPFLLCIIPPTLQFQLEFPAPFRGWSTDPQSEVSGVQKRDGEHDRKRRDQT